MKVKNLIKALSGCDPEADIIFDGDWEYFTFSCVYVGNDGDWVGGKIILADSDGSDRKIIYEEREY